LLCAIAAVCAFAIAALYPFAIAALYPFAIAAIVAPAAVTRSAGASSICRPRCPPLQNTVSYSSADESITTGMRLRSPSGDMPPVTYPAARSATAGSAIAAFFHRNDGDGQCSVDIGDQRLEHAARRDAHRLAGLQAVRPMPGVVLVAVHHMADARLDELIRCPGSTLLCH
jgi:hypothetical protein